MTPAPIFPSSDREWRAPTRQRLPKPFTARSTGAAQNHTSMLNTPRIAAACIAIALLAALSTAPVHASLPVQAGHPAPAPAHGFGSGDFFGTADDTAASVRPQTQDNVVKINTLSLLLGTGSIFYERRLQENLSAQLGTAFLRYTFEGTTFGGLILTPEMRFYPRDNASSGFYMAPYLRLQQFTLKSGGDKGVYRNLGGGLLLGRQWITRSDFTMDLFFGGHYGRGTIDIDDGEDDEDFDTEVFEGFRPRVGFAIGFAF